MGECLNIAELADLHGLAESDPRRRHVADCPRCGALLASLEAFTDQDDLPAGANLSDADARLSAFLEERIASAGADVEDSSAKKAAVARAGAWRAWLQGMKARPLRPALALAGLALIVLGGTWLRDRSPELSPHPLLRGETGEEAEGLAFYPPLPVGDDSLRIHWRPLAGATAYRVTLYGPDLLALSSIDAGSDSSLVLARRPLTELADEQGVVFWGVSAFRGRDELSPSRLHQLELSP